MKLLYKKTEQSKKFIFANIPGSVPVGGFIAPTDATDVYAAIDPIWGIDGHRSVDTLATRDAITVQRRREGMLCYVQAEGKTYQLQGGIANANWSEFGGGGGGTGTNTNESFEITATDAANGYVDISNTPNLLEHFIVEKNGQILTWGALNDYTVSGTRITFNTQLSIEGQPDQITVYYSYL